MRGACCVGIGVLAAAIAVPQPASARPAKPGKPTQVVPAKKKKKRGWPGPEVDTSDAGQRRGALEITLGSLTAALAGVLIGRGAWEVVSARRLEEDCAAGRSDDMACDFWDNPGRPGRIGAALSFAAVVPVGVASGLLLARGIRIRRDHRKWHAQHAVAVRPVVGPATAGLVIGGRF